MADAHKLFPQLWENVHALVLEAVSRADSMRTGARPPGTTAGPGDLWEYAVDLRGRLDSVAGTLITLRDLRSRARIAMQELRWVYEDKRAEVITTDKPEQFSTAEERSARYDAKALNERIAVRKMTRIEADVAEALEHVQLIYQLLDGERRDINSAYSALNTETRLERS